MRESCTKIAVCSFTGPDPRNWAVDAVEFGPEESHAAEERARTERARGGERVVLVVRRYTSSAGATRRSEWRTSDGEVIIASEDFA